MLPCTKAWARLPRPCSPGREERNVKLFISPLMPQSHSMKPAHNLLFSAIFRFPGHSLVLPGMRCAPVCSWLEQNVLVLKYSSSMGRDVFQRNQALLAPLPLLLAHLRGLHSISIFGNLFLDFRVLDGGLRCWEWRERYRWAQPIVTSPRDRRGILDIFLEVNSLKTGHWEYSARAINPSPTLCCPPSISWNLPLSRGAGTCGPPCRCQGQNPAWAKWVGPAPRMLLIISHLVRIPSALQPQHKAFRVPTPRKGNQLPPSPGL